MAENKLVGNKKIMDGAKKVGKGSKFHYRCVFDPSPVTKEDSDEANKSSNDPS